jgi:hypothetical protein
MVYDSVYEANNYLRGTARNQRFWEYFSGSKLQEASATDEVTGGTTDAGFNGNLKGFGSKVQTGDTLVGKKITKLSIELKNNGIGVGGNITLGVFNTTSSTPVFTFGTFSASTLTSSYQYFEQENLTGHTLVADQVLGFIASGDISNLKLRRYNGGTGGRPTLYGMYHAVSTGSNWQNAGDAQDINMKVGYAGGARWNFKAGAGGVVIGQGMSDSVDGGYQLIMTNGHIGTYDFAQKRQFNYDGAVIIGVCKRTMINGIGGIGFVGDNTASDSGGGTGYMNRRVTRLLIRNSSLTIQGMTSNASGATYHDTGVTSDNNYHVLKTELTSGGTHFSVDGVLGHSSTGSEHETDEKLQPMFMAWASGSSGGVNINYMEAYNT